MSKYVLTTCMQYAPYTKYVTYWDLSVGLIILHTYMPSRIQFEFDISDQIEFQQ